MPQTETIELLRLALVIRGDSGDSTIDPNGSGARHALEQLFRALDSVEYAGLRLRDLALMRQIATLGDGSAAISDLHDLARLAGVSAGHVARQARPPDGSLAVHGARLDSPET